MASTEFFEPIGALAQKADNLPDKPHNAEQAEEDDERPLQEIESLCMSCGEQVRITRMMLTNIPYFKEVIIMSFRCEHCGNENNEIQSAGIIRELGTLYTARILDKSDLDRQLVKSETCNLVIPELELTIPASRGQLTTVEGIIRDTVRDLSLDQPLRCIQDPTTYEKIEVLLNKLKDILGDEDEDKDEKETTGPVETKDASKSEKPLKPFTVQLDDPSGNSWIEFYGSMQDPKWSMRQYERTPEQNAAIGIGLAEGAPTVQAKHVASAKEAMENTKQEGDDDVIPNEEIYVFPGDCSSCSAPLDTMMKRVVIPYFKDIFIMSTNCAACGYRDNEIKSGGAISEHGKRITLKVEDSEDLSRDILKSETCGLEIPEIDLVLQPGTLGGRFTTLEGLLTQVYEELGEKVFVHGDASSTKDDKITFEKFLANLKEVTQAKRPFTVILDDPLANSYLQNLYAPDPDPGMTVETYERAWEQNEELGLNDMVVEGYNADSGGEEVPEPGKGAPRGATVAESLKEGFKEAYEQVKSGDTGIA
ncbi:zf-ZPR1-domain-containing protein [Rhizoctonia solani]|nr:zf-ZPR1-domain-containing protein [Rhizoctonia solani]